MRAFLGTHFFSLHVKTKKVYVHTNGIPHPHGCQAQATPRSGDITSGRKDTSDNQKKSEKMAQNQKRLNSNNNAVQGEVTLVD